MSNDDLMQIKEIYDSSAVPAYVEHLASIWEEDKVGALPLREFCCMLGRMDVRSTPLMVADLGCGTGRDLPLIGSWARRAVRVIGCDVSATMLSHAPKQSEVIQLSIEEFLRGRVSCFDGIWCHFSLIHLREREMLAEHLALIYSALGSNGIFGIGLKCGDGQHIDDPPDESQSTCETHYILATD